MFYLKIVKEILKFVRHLNFIHSNNEYKFEPLLVVPNKTKKNNNNNEIK